MVAMAGGVDLRPEVGEAHAAHLRHLALCRRDVNAFNEYVLKSDDTGLPIVQAPLHISWHKVIDLYPRVVLWSHPEAGKTNQLSIGRVLWEIGRNPNIRVAVISRTKGGAKKIVSAIKEVIEASPEFREVFPGIRPGRDWSSYQLTVVRSRTGMKEPTVQAFGVHGQIQGSRVDLLVLDDVLNDDNTRTQAAREEMLRWYRGTIVGRLTRASRVVCICNQHDPQDLAHTLAKGKNWRAFRFPVLDEDNQPTWPEAFNAQRILALREELQEEEFDRIYMLAIHADRNSRFKVKYLTKALELGRGLGLIEYLEEIPYGCSVFTGVDLGITENDKSDLTVLTTILVFPDKRRRLLWVEGGHWEGPEIVRRIIATYNRYGSIVMVENNAAQQYILQFVREESDVPVVPFTTGKNKADPKFGVESMAVEFANGKWLWPNDAGVMDATVRAVYKACLSFSPRPGAHTPDHLMSLWFAREAARRWERTDENRGSVGVRVLGATEDAAPATG